MKLSFTRKRASSILNVSPKKNEPAQPSDHNKSAQQLNNTVERRKSKRNSLFSRNSLKRLSLSTFCNNLTKSKHVKDEDIIRDKLSKNYDTLVPEGKGKDKSEWISNNVNLLKDPEMIREVYFGDIDEWIDYVRKYLQKSDSHKDDDYIKFRDELSSIDVKMYLSKVCMEETDKHHTDSFLQFGKNVFHWGCDSLVHVKSFNPDMFPADSWMTIELTTVNLYMKEFHHMSTKISETMHQYITKQQYSIETCKSYHFVWDVMSALNLQLPE